MRKRQIKTHNTDKSLARQEELATHPVVNPDYSKFQTGDTIKHVANSKAYDRSSAVAGVQTGKHYPDYNSAYRTPEQMGNFVNSGGVPSHDKHTDNVRLKHISVNPQRRFDDSQLDRPFSDRSEEIGHGHDVNHPKHPKKSRKLRNVNENDESRHDRQAREANEAKEVKEVK